METIRKIFRILTCPSAASRRRSADSPASDVA
jgi:hypothetical protein